MPEYGIYEDGRLTARFVAPLKVRSNQPIFSSDTLSLKRPITRRAAQRWEIETNLEPLVHGANDLFASLVSKGHSETVTVRMPQNYGAYLKRTAVSSNPSAVGSRGSTVVNVSGLSGLIPAGTFVRFATHSKVYMTTLDRQNSGVMNVYPALRKDVAGGFTYREDVMMPCLFDTDTIIGMSYTDGIMMDMGTVKFIERL